MMRHNLKHMFGSIDSAPAYKDMTVSKAFESHPDIAEMSLSTTVTA